MPRKCYGHERLAGLSRAVIRFRKPASAKSSLLIAQPSVGSPATQIVGDLAFHRRVAILCRLFRFNKNNEKFDTRPPCQSQEPRPQTTDTILAGSRNSQCKVGQRGSADTVDREVAGRRSCRGSASIPAISEPYGHARFAAGKTSSLDDKDGSGSYFCNQCGQGLAMLLRKPRGSTRHSLSLVDAIIGTGPGC